MFSLVKNRLLGLKKVAGVALSVSKDGACSLKLCVLEKDKRDVIKIVQKESNIASIRALSQLIEKNTPIVVVLDGKGILNKICALKDIDNKTLLNETFPGANLDDFYFDLSKLKDKCVVSIVRKDLLDKIAKEMEINHLSVVDFTISPFIITSTLDYLTPQVVQISIGKYILEIHNNQIFDINPNNEDPDSSSKSYFIGEEAVEEKFLNVYAAALEFFIHHDQEQLRQVIFSVSKGEEWKQKQIFQNSLKIILGVALLLLISNTIVFFYFKDTQEQLTAQFSQNSARLTHLSRLKEDITQKKIFLGSMGWLSKNNIALFSDRLAATLPDELFLTTMTFHPINEKLSEGVRGQIFESNIVYIEGKCNSPIILNDWFSNLKTLNWIIRINKQKYKYNDKQKTGFFSFEIELAR